MELQKLADETGLVMTVCHFPPGTSKWNKIEHRPFSFMMYGPAVIVILAPPDTPAHRAALRGLCAALNRVGALFAGTRLPVRYAVSVHHSERAA